MPNWCANRLKITGPKKDLQAIKKALVSQNDKGEETVFSFQTLVPMPENLRNMGGLPLKESPRLTEVQRAKVAVDFANGLIDQVEAYEKSEDAYLIQNDDWYNWGIINWGTKWDVSEVSVLDQIADGALIYNFETAWSPPRSWVRRASPKFPTLSFELLYVEPGMDFAGQTVYEAGGLMVDEGAPADDIQSYLRDLGWEEGAEWAAPPKEEGEDDA
jgi:hypothetical protein